MTTPATERPPLAAATGGPRIEIRDLAMEFGPLRKTTILRNIDGLLKPAEGEVRVNGVRVTAPPKGVAVVFQMFGLFPWKTVYENIAYGLRMAGASKEHIREKVP